MVTQRRICRALLASIVAQTVLLGGCQWPWGTVPITSVTVTAAGGVAAVVCGKTLQLSVVIAPPNATNAGVTWSVTDGSGHATVSTHGLLTAVSPGTVTVTAKAKDGSGASGSLGLTMEARLVPVTKIAISGDGGASSMTTPLGTLQMHASVTPTNASAANVTWAETDGTGKATISPSGLLFALANGTVTVTATACDGSGVTGTRKISLSGQPTVVSIPVTVGQNRHTWNTLLGGVVWILSRATNKQIAATLPDLPGTVLVDIKADANGFGYRFDEDFWEPDAPTYSWFPWNGSDDDPATLDDLFQIYGAENVKFILNVPVPNLDQLQDPEAYPWQTPEFYGAECQYLFGAADDPSTYQSLPWSIDFTTAPASFNWADLRARRGHPAPYPVEAIILGIEAYYVDGWGWDLGSYAARAEQFRQAIRARGITIPYGVQMGNALMHIPNSSQFDPIMNALSSSDPPTYYDLFHSYTFDFDNDWSRTFPVAVNPNGFTYWPGLPSTWDMDYSHYLYFVNDARSALTNRGLSSAKLGWSEHGITVSSQFEWNDMSGAIHWALWLAETMRLNTQWDSLWCLGGEGFSTALVQVRETVIKPPAFYVYQTAMGLLGKTYVDLQYDSPMGSCLWQINDTVDTVQYPYLVIRALRDPSSGKLSLFVINQDPTRYYRLTGLESSSVSGWSQISGTHYTDGDPFAPLHGQETVPVHTGPVSKDPAAPLVFDPVSITRVDLQ